MREVGQREEWIGEARGLDGGGDRKFVAIESHI